MAPPDRPATNVLFEVWRLSRRIGSALDAALEPAGTTASDFGLYSLLAVDGPMTPTELVSRSATPATTISQALRRLEERGHLRRRPHPEDGRSTLVELTNAGMSHHEQATGPFLGMLSRFEEQLGGDLEQVRGAIHRLEVAAATITGEPAPPPLASSRAVDSSPLDGLTETQARELVDFAAWLRWRGAPP